MAVKAQEIWEATTDGTTYVNVRDPRNPEGWKKRKVGGKGSRRITLSKEEREFNQELVPYENRDVDPFVNGLLIQITPGTVDRGENHLSDDDLVGVLSMKEDADFEAAVTVITSEVIARRLLALAERHAPMMRHQFIRDLVDDRYAVGKASLVARETDSDTQRYADI